MNEPEAMRRATPQIRWIVLSTVLVWIVTMTVTWELTRGDYYRTYTSAWWVWAFVLAGGWTASAFSSVNAHIDGPELEEEGTAQRTNRRLADDRGDRHSPSHSAGGVRSISQ